MPWAVPTYSSWLSGDFFVVVFDQAQLSGRLEAQVSGEEACHPLQIELAIREVGPRVRRSLDDPDLPGSSIGVVELTGVVNRGDCVGPAVDEEDRPGLEPAEHGDGAGLRDSNAVAQPNPETDGGHEGSAGEKRVAADVLPDHPPEVAEGAVQDECLHRRIAGSTEQADDGTHRIPQQADPRAANTPAGEGDRRLQLLDLADPHGDNGAVAPRHAAIGVDEDVESLAPERHRDAEQTLPAALVPGADHDDLGRSALPEEPGSEGDPVRRHQIDVFVVDLELPGREGEVVQEGGGCRPEEPPVEDGGKEEKGSGKHRD